MSSDENSTPNRDKRLSILFYESFRRRVRQLPISFYLILAIIAALLLGVTGFTDLDNPRKLAFSLTLFVIFFGAVIYRALIDAADIYRDYHRKNVTLLSDVMERDGFSRQLREKTGSPHGSDVRDTDA